MADKFWNEERLNIVREVYMLPNVTEHMIAVTEIKKRGIPVTLAIVQNIAYKYHIPRPYLSPGAPIKNKK